MKLLACLLAVGLLSACGYRATYAGDPPTARLSVTSGPHGTAESVVVDAVLVGVREELAAEGVLASGSAYPTLVVEVVRVDEVGRGLIAGPAAPGGRLPSSSRGAAVAVVARGWVVERAGEHATRDSGDMRRSVGFAHAGDPRADALRRRDAVRAAGFEAGRAVARWVLGDPEPRIEPL